MTVRLLLRAHNKGYFRRDGTYVHPFNDKRMAALPPPPAALPKAKKPKQYSMDDALFGKKKPLKDDDTYFGVPVGGKSGHAHVPSQGSLFGGEAGSLAKWAEKFSSYLPKTPPKPSYPNAIKHPKADDAGKPFQINEPSTPSAPETWTDPKSVATFVPGGKTPDALNGVPFAPWTGAPTSIEDWDYVDGQMDDLVEPTLKLPIGKEPAAGCIIEEPDGRVWIVRPSNGFAGYRATFPKGHAEDDLSLQAAAIKEVWEESGLKVAITGFAVDAVRGQTVTRYYHAKRVGGTPADCGWESQAVQLVPKDRLFDLLNSAKDAPVARAAGASAYADDSSGWEKIGGQAGSNKGGTYLDDDGVAWYCKYPQSPSHARNEVLAAKLYEACGTAVPEVKLVHDGSALGVASQIIDGLQADPAALKAGAPGVREGFAVDAWLANWDSVGLAFDNMLMDPDGQAVRLDTGGSLLFRAQGAPKGDAFGDKVGEIESLRGGKNLQAAMVFGKVTKAQIAAGVKRIKAVPDAKIRALCMDLGPGSAAQRAKLADRLIARKADLVKRYP